MVPDGPQEGIDTLHALLRARASKNPDAPFLFFKDEVWSLRRIDEASECAAEELRRKGLRPGDRVAMRLPNGPDFIVNFFGIMKAGMVAVPINTALKGPEIDFILKDSGAATWFRPGHELDPLTPGSDTAPAGTASIIYTSGTTGFPKGAALTHRNYLWDVSTLVKTIGMTDRDRFLCFLPLFHVNGQVVTLLSPLYAGGSMVLMERFQPKEFFELLSKHRCTAFSGVPSVYSVLLNLPDAERYDLSSLRFCICGAAPMPVDVFERFEAKFKAHILEGYGLSEGTCVSSVNPPPPGSRKVGSIGLSIPGQEMRIVDDADGDLGPDTVGEIAVRGPNVMAGYWNNPAATADALRGGWLHTGDLGSRDSDGFFYIRGRKKEMIIRGGENIYPKEIEEVLYRHPAVAEAAVVGLPDKRWGEEVAAFLVLREGASLPTAELRAYLKERLADYKLPRRIEFVASLPKTATGKIQKHVLRECFLKTA